MILVTGGTGLIGAHILYDLCLTEEKVRAIKRETSDLYQIESTFEYYSPNNFRSLLDKIEWVDADITNIDDLLDATQNISIVYHAAAIVSFSKKDVDRMIQSNIDGTANLVNACKENGVKKIGHISSVAALGPSKHGEPLTEEHHWEISPDNSNYAVSKHGAEQEVWRISEEGVDVVMVNPGIVLGPGDWKRSSTAVFWTAYDKLKYYTNGSTGFVDVRDVSSAIIKLVNSEIKSERYIMVSENVVWKDMFTMICKAFGIPAPTKLVTKGKAELAWRVLKVLSWFTGKPPKATKETARSATNTRLFDNKKIKSALDFQFIPVSESIAHSVDFIKKYYISKSK